jgi:hypothetical protein
MTLRTRDYRGINPALYKDHQRNRTINFPLTLISLIRSPRFVFDSVHPFFLAPTSMGAASAKARPAPKKTTGKDHPASKAGGSTNPSRSRASVLNQKHSGTRPPQSSTLTTSKTRMLSSPMLPVYSFKDYTHHSPMMVFTNAEDEANDLVTGLKAG